MLRRISATLAVACVCAYTQAAQASPPDLNADGAALQKAQDQLNKDVQSLSRDPNSVSATQLGQDQAAVKAARDRLNADLPALASNPTAANATQYGCISRSNADTYCLVTGAFAIPFRAELTGKKDVLGGVSADVFAGINFHTSWTGGLDPTLLIYAGYLPTLSASNSNTSANSDSGAVDFGAGVAFPVKTDINPTSNQTVHAGAVVGFDVTSGANHFAYNGKPYISAFIGLSF